MKQMVRSFGMVAATVMCAFVCGAEKFPKPYSSTSVERKNVFEFSEKPAVKYRGNDKFEITFAVKGLCDVTVGVIDKKGVVVRHVASGVLGANAPAPFQKNSLKQKIYWNGKDDMQAYVKKPQDLRIRVMLGLKPELDKRLGHTNPKSMPGGAWSVAADADGVYALSLGRGERLHVRAFDHDGNYIRTVSPPPANLPEKKRAGMGYIEYESGKRAMHARDVYSTTANYGRYMANGKRAPRSLQTAIHNGQIFYMNNPKRGLPSLINVIGTDGSTNVVGQSKERVWNMAARMFHRWLAISPDGRFLYGTSDGYGGSNSNTVSRRAVDGKKHATRFIGGKPGSSNKHLNRPHGLDCDAKGRIYVADHINNRVQIFSADGKYLKTLPVDRPKLVRVHQKTGGIYVLHATRVKGKSIGRLTKFGSFADPRIKHTLDGVGGVAMAVDSWSPKPRIWFAAGVNFTAWEETAKGFNKIVDFVEDVKKTEGAIASTRWSGAYNLKVNCDPLRGKVYYCQSRIFDLKTGALSKHPLRLTRIDDIAFDKRGYLHAHFNPGFNAQGVGRLDPDRKKAYKPPYGNKYWVYSEVPYDYGVPGKGKAGGWAGVLPVKCQPGAKFFQDGVGVNMRGDVAVQSNIYYVPKMSDMTLSVGWGGNAREACKANSYPNFLKRVEEKKKRGETVYSLRRRPGHPLAGATIWTFDSTGELRNACAVTDGSLINGVQMDEDGNIYYVGSRKRLRDGRPFLAGKGGTFGVKNDKNKQSPFTGTLMKTAGKDVRMMSKNAPVPMDSALPRPLELGSGFGHPESSWMEGAEWFYAGASPIVSHGCSCPTLRLHTDWYKRTYVPEAYRHSIGIVDTNGNLIMHLGRYGNFDSADGSKSKIPLGGDGIAISFNEMVSGTDDYLVFEDNGDRLTVLKLNYHAEETIKIKQ